MKQLIDGLIDHSYELKALLKNQEVHEYSIQIELNKLEGKQLGSIPEIKQIAQSTQSYKGQTDIINLGKLLDNCKLLRDKNYKIDKDQFSLTKLITELKEKIQSYIRNQQISFRTFFRQLALNNDQQMEQKEFQTGLKKKLALIIDDFQAIQLFKKIDQNQDFQLSYEEFYNFMQGEEKIEIKPILRKIRKKILRKDGENLQEVFNRIDINKDKRINFEEWKSAMNQLSLDLTFDEVSALYKHFDQNGQDGINYEHFEMIMLEDHMSLKQWTRQIEDYCNRYNLNEQTIFRKFNLQGKDIMSFREFKQLLEAVDSQAVRSFDNDQYEDIFNIFDQDKDYQISLQEFQKILNLQKGKGALTESTTQVIIKLLHRIRRKALNQQINLQWELQQYDFNRFNKVRFEDWSRVIKRFCDLAPSELELLFKNFDKEDTNSIEITEFITQIQKTNLTDDINTLIDKIVQFQRKFNFNDQQFWNKFCRVEGQNWKFEEFTKMLESIYFECQKEEKDEYFQNFDFDNDNQISFNDFLSALQKNFRLKMNFDQFLNPSQQLYQYPTQQQSSFNNQQFQQQQQLQSQYQQYSFSQKNQQQQGYQQQQLQSPFYDPLQPKITETTPYMQSQFNMSQIPMNAEQISMNIITELQQVEFQTNRDIFQAFTDYDIKRNFELQSPGELEIIIRGLARMNFKFTQQDSTVVFQKYSKNMGQTMHFGQLLYQILGARAFIFKGLKYLLEKQILQLNQIVPTQGLYFDQFCSTIFQFLQIQSTQQELRQIFDTIDTNHNDIIQQNEIIHILQLQMPNAFQPDKLVQSMKREILNSSRAQQLSEGQLFDVFFIADNSKQFNYSTPNELKQALIKMKIMKSDQEINVFYKFYSRDGHSVNYLKIFSDLFNSELALRLALLKIIEFQRITAEKLFKSITNNAANLTQDSFFNFCEKIRMQIERPEANAIYQQYINKSNNKFSLKEFQVFLSMSGQRQQFGGLSQIIQFEENMFLDERPILLRMAKEMQQNKNILTVAELFKTPDKFVSKQAYFQAIVWLGFNQNDNQIISLAQKLSNPDNFGQIQVDWFEQALRKLGNLGQHMQQKWGSDQKQVDQQFNWEEQNFLNNLPEAIKDTANEIAEAVVEDKVGMFAFQKYDRGNRGKISTKELDQVIYVDLQFEKDRYLDNFIMVMSKNGQVDLKLLEKVLNSKGTLSKFQQQGSSPSRDMYGITSQNIQTKNLTQQEIAKAQQLVEIIKKQCKSEEQINDYFFPLGSPSAITLQMFSEKMNGIKNKVNLKPQEIELLFNYLDASSNGVLTVQEFKLVFEGNQSIKKNIHNIKITGRLQDEIRVLFKQLDTNNNNSLDQAELSQALQQIGICPNPQELQEYFRRIDLDRNGAIDYTEFSNFMIQKLKEEMISMEEFQQNIRREFKRVDINKTRQLTRSQMDTLFRNLGYELERQEFEILFSEIDVDQSGLIDIDELIYFLCSNKRDISETAKMAILNINCAHISVADLASTFSQLPDTFINSFLRKLNRQGFNHPSSALKLQLDPSKLYYKDLLYTLPPGVDQYYPQASNITKPILRRIVDPEWFEIKINQLTGVPIPDKKNAVLGRELKFCLMDTVANFVGNTAKVKAYWSQQHEDRWQFQPTAQQQSVSFFDAHMKDENSVLVRIQKSQIDKIEKLIIELIIYIKNQDKVIAISCGWIEIVFKDLLNQNKITFELPIQSGMPANSKALSNVKVQRKGWSKFVQKLSSPIKSQIQFEIIKSVKFPNDYKDMVNCLPPTIILNKFHLNYFSIYREYVALKMIDPQYNRGGPSLHKSPKVKAFIMGINSPDFLEMVTRFWYKMEQSQQFRELAKSANELFKIKIKCFESIQDQAYLLMNNISFKYNFADPTYPSHYDLIAKNRNPLYADFMSTVQLKLNPARSGQMPVKKDWYNNLEPFNTASLSDDEEDNILLSKFKSKVLKERKKGLAQTSYQPQQQLTGYGYQQQVNSGFQGGTTYY